MRLPSALSIGVGLALPMLLASGLRGEAQSLLHRGPCTDCKDAQQQTITLPAQQIRIQTTRPQVIVNEASPRMRGYFPASHAMMPMVHAPYVANFYTPAGLQPLGMIGVQSSTSSTLDAIHALERQQLNFVKQKAALKAEMDHTDQVIQRVQSSLSATLKASGSSSDLADINASIQKMNTRLDAIERLLLIHDNILKEKK